MSVIAAFMLINMAATITSLILRHRRALKSLDDDNDEGNVDTSQSTNRTGSFNSYTSEDSNLTAGSDGSRKCYGSCDSTQGSTGMSYVSPSAVALCKVLCNDIKKIKASSKNF